MRAGEDAGMGGEGREVQERGCGTGCLLCCVVCDRKRQNSRTCACDRCEACRS